MSRARQRHAKVVNNGASTEIGHGAVVIAAITSCTNTSNPSVMLAAGLLAKKAVARGLTVKSYVKTSIAPGSRVVSDYLDKAGLTEALEAVGFNIVGYGCTTCIGNSGPLPEPVANAVTEGDLVAAAVLSGNRNFEGRINPLVRANYLASPPLVVAYALAGTTDIDLTTEPLGTDQAGKPVYLKDIWPTHAEIAAGGRDQRAARNVPPPLRQRARRQRSSGTNSKRPKAMLYDWVPDSTYIQEPPYLCDLTREPVPIKPITGARVLAALGDSVTTDHISPAGSIAAKSPGRPLLAGAGGHAAGVQQLRRPPRQRSGDDPRHVRQYPHSQSAGSGHRGGRHPAPARRQADEHLRRVGRVCQRGRAAGGAGRRRVWHRQQPRLGGQGHVSAGRAGRAGRQLRAHPPQQPGGHGRLAARNCPTGRVGATWG